MGCAGTAAGRSDVESASWKTANSLTYPIALWQQHLEQMQTMSLADLAKETMRSFLPSKSGRRRFAYARLSGSADAAKSIFVDKSPSVHQTPRKSSWGKRGRDLPEGRIWTTAGRSSRWRLHGRVDLAMRLRCVSRNNLPKVKSPGLRLRVFVFGDHRLAVLFDVLCKQRERVCDEPGRHFHYRPQDDSVDLLGFSKLNRQ